MGVRFARPSLVMQALRLLLLTLMAPVASASTSFQPLDRVEGWLIERRLDANQDPICRASVPGPGTDARHGFIWMRTTRWWCLPDCIGRTKRGWRLCVMRSAVVAPVFFTCSG